MNLSNSSARAVVRVPASTSNLGPGFDTLGIALNLYNRIEIRRAQSRGVKIISAIEDKARTGAIQMLTEAARAFWKESRARPFGIEADLTGDVPIARGLGSSVTARLGVIAGLNEMTHAGISRHRLMEIVARLEHHPDNAAPAVFGGFNVAGLTGKTLRSFHVPVAPQLRFVTLIPRFEISTEMARQLVPDQFSKADTIHNLNRAALITAAFAQRDYDQLRGLFEDRVHQPYRQRLIPQLFKVIAAGEKAGALGGWLSGSGSTIICLTLENSERIGSAMRRQLPDSEIKILRADNRGLQIL